MVIIKFTTTLKNAPECTSGHAKFQNHATVTKEGGGTEDVKKHLSKAQGAFFNLKKIWNTRSIGHNTKIKLTVFKNLVRPVLLYRCEAWKLTAAEEKKLDYFNSHA